MSKFKQPSDGVLPSDENKNSTIGSRFGRRLDLLLCFFKRCCGFGYSLNGEKETYGPFLTLGSLAVTGGGALAAVLQLTDNKNAVYCIYIFLSLLTISGICRILATSNGLDKKVSYYDFGTMRFGRWTLLSSCLISIILTILFSFGALDFSRSRFEKLAIALEKPVIISEWKKQLKGKGVSGAHLTEAESFADLFTYAEKSFQSNEPKATAHILVASQTFSNSYLPFRATLKGDQTPKILLRLAFLYRTDGGNGESKYQPMYRQIPFDLDDKGNITNSLYVVNPNKGDKLMIVLVADKFSMGDNWEIVR